MDARMYDPMDHVASTHFSADQRTRLEAFTAAKLLKPNVGTYEQLDVAGWIATGEQVVAYLADD